MNEIDASSPASFDDLVLRVLDDGVALVGARCEECDRRFFPAAQLCPRCGGAASRQLLPQTGTLHSKAIINAPVTIYPTPATIVQVDLLGVRVGGWLRSGAPTIGAACRLSPLILERDGEPVVAYCFDVIPGADDA